MITFLTKSSVTDWVQALSSISSVWLAFVALRIAKQAASREQRAEVRRVLHDMFSKIRADELKGVHLVRLREVIRSGITDLEILQIAELENDRAFGRGNVSLKPMVEQMKSIILDLEKKR